MILPIPRVGVPAFAGLSRYTNVRAKALLTAVLMGIMNLVRMEQLCFNGFTNPILGARLMPKFTTWDFPIAVSLFVVAAASTLLLTTDGNPDRFAQVSKISRPRMVARLAVVVGGLTFFCFLLDISVVVIMAVLLGFLALGWCLSEVAPISFWNPAIVILYVFQQYVLGFPDRDDWILPSPKSDELVASGELNQWIAHQGVTCTVIKPTGIAEIDGKRFDVISELGNLIESEKAIVVSAVNGNRLVIRELAVSS